MMEDRFLKHLRKKARKGLRGWPIATVAIYGPNLSQATKVAVGIVPSENAEVEELRDWKVDRGDIRSSRLRLDRCARRGPLGPQRDLCRHRGDRDPARR